LNQYQKVAFLANSDDEDEPNERPVGVKRPLNNTFQPPNKRIREEPQVEK
jgi:hypothetical protein